MPSETEPFVAPLETAPERRVRILPPQLINRIAAGEVVERPASVIKELVENALDAGATRIDIRAGAAGRSLRVADNGGGMRPEDAALAFYNHATSKIREADDLDRIETLGFRGEALASIGAIARLTCLTRTADAPKGTRVTLDERGEPQLSEVGCAPGTVMEVEDLFYNTPARLKFLKRAQTELGHIEETVQYLALSHPEVRLTLTLSDKEALKTSGSGQLKRCLEEVFGLHREALRLLPITAEDAEAGLRLAGFASEPGVMKSSKRWMVTYVNGRHVRCGILQKAIEAAYESLLPHGKYPLCVLFLTLPPDEVDVNVHPTKREVRYAAGSAVFGFVRSGIRVSLSGQGIALDAPASAAWTALPLTGASHSAPPLLDAPAKGEPDGPRFADFTARPPRPALASDPRPVQAALDFYQPALQARPEEQPAGVLPLAAMKPCTPEAPTPARFKVVGQLFHTYILLETAQGLMVVDQHIASERAFFELLTRNLSAETPAVQRLMTVTPQPVSPLQADLLRRHQADFARLGFEYAVDDAARAVSLQGFPLVYAGRDGMFQHGGLFENLLAQLEETGEMKPDLDHLIATLACHTAVRAGDALSEAEMQTVVARWLACELPWTCPHGRPIAHTISKNELNHFFHRPSLPVSAI